MAAFGGITSAMEFEPSSKLVGSNGAVQNERCWFESASKSQSWKGLPATQPSRLGPCWKHIILRLDITIPKPAVGEGDAR